MATSANGHDADQQRLRHEAESIVERLGLMSLLSTYGQAGIVGSVPLELIVKRDIDVHLLLASGVDPLSVALCICRTLLDQSEIGEVRISDYRQTQGAVKIGVDTVAGASGAWSVDVWITSRVETAGFERLRYLKLALTPQWRTAVLELKRHFYAAGQLNGGLSDRIYTAVCDHGVMSREVFDRWRTGQDG